MRLSSYKTIWALRDVGQYTFSLSTNTNTKLIVMRFVIELDLDLSRHHNAFLMYVYMNAVKITFLNSLFITINTKNEWMTLFKLFVDVC